ncbi:MAG TPA: CRISPR-associated endonuclease Cas2 [Porticoccaceae bacterium]
MVSHYLLCYDIADPKRLQRVYRACCKVGIPFQYSVFCVTCDEQRIKDVLKTLEGLIDAAEDDVRVYRISTPDAIITLGESLMPDDILLL